MTVLVLAISLTVLAGGHTPSPPPAAQASQTVASNGIADTSTAAPPASRPIRAAQTIDNQATSDSSSSSSSTTTVQTQTQTSQTESSGTPQSPPSTPDARPAPTLSVTQGKLERLESSDAVTYTVHFSVSTSDGAGSPTVHAKLTPDTACDKGTTEASFTAASQTDLTLSCTYAKATWQSLPTDLTFKLDITSDTAASSLTYHSTK